jgi:hypothetical protein
VCEIRVLLQRRLVLLRSAVARARIMCLIVSSDIEVVLRMFVRVLMREVMRAEAGCLLISMDAECASTSATTSDHVSC